MMVRWPGVVKAGTQSNEIISLLDWFPTLCAAASAGDIVAKMKKGFNTDGKPFKVRLDGYDFGPYLRGEAKAGPRGHILYFEQGGNLNALRIKDWKLSFAQADRQRERPAPDHCAFSLAPGSCTSVTESAASSIAPPPSASAKTGSPPKKDLSKAPSMVAASSCGTTMKMLNMPM